MSLEILTSWRRQQLAQNTSVEQNLGSHEWTPVEIRKLFYCSSNISTSNPRLRSVYHNTRDGRRCLGESIGPRSVQLSLTQHVRLRSIIRCHNPFESSNEERFETARVRQSVQVSRQTLLPSYRLQSKLPPLRMGHRTYYSCTLSS